jgi:hypothetical protein
MTTMTLAPATGGFSDNHPDYYLGRADAYDDARTRTVDELVVLAGMAIDYATIPYAQGYTARVTELRLELDAVAPMEMELAQTWLTRKQGREHSTLTARHGRTGRRVVGER